MVVISLGFWFRRFFIFYRIFVVFVMRLCFFVDRDLSRVCLSCNDTWEGR